MSKWINTTIGEHCTITSSKRFHLSERSKEGVPFYCSKEIIQKTNGQEITECDFIREELYEEVKREYGVPEAGDLLITTRGTYGVPYIYQSSDRFYFADGNLTWLKNFDELLMAEYLYYWVQTPEGQGKIDGIAKGTAQKAVPIASIKMLDLQLPTVLEQQKIVKTLKAYDDLIENNRKQIRLLEEATQRIYKEWFVDLHFPEHENAEMFDGIPKGWKTLPLSEFIDYEIGGGWGEEEIQGECELPAHVIRGTDFYGITHGDFEHLPFRLHSQSNLDARRLKDGDIIFEVSGGSKTEGVARTVLVTNQLLRVIGGDVICASFCKLIRSKRGLSQYLFDTFQFLRASGQTVAYDKRSASSIVNYRWKDFLMQQELSLPPEELLVKYNTVATAIYDRIIMLSIQIKTAREARDRLLPKLMSGEIEP